MRRAFCIGAAAASLGALTFGGCRAGPGSIDQATAPRDADALALPDPVFDPANGEVLSARRWRERLDASHWVLLGERHDNRAHHAVRARMLRQWTRSIDPGAARPTIVFEHFDREHRDALLEASGLVERDAGAEREGGIGLAGGIERAGGIDEAGLEPLLRAGGFDRRAWGWPAHAALFDAALDAARIARARWIAANVSREEARVLLRDAPAGSSLQGLIDRASWSPHAQSAIEEAMREGHCNMLPAAALPSLVRVQRMRDAAMAAALIEAPGRAMLLAGNGHVRRDFGVPRYLGDGRRGPNAGAASGRSTLVVGFVEREDRPAPGREMEPDPGLAKRYDLVVLSAPVTRDDPCRAFLSPATPARTPPR